MKFFYSALLLASFIIFSGCGTMQLPEPYASDFSTSGPLGDDCFQVVVKMVPDKDALTMHERRESAFIKAKKNIHSEVEKQIISYILASHNNGTALTSEDSTIKKMASSYAGSGKLEQEFYLIDDSVVLIYRIYKKGIKNEILSK